MLRRLFAFAVVIALCADAAATTKPTPPTPVPDLGKPASTLSSTSDAAAKSDADARSISAARSGSRSDQSQENAASATSGGNEQATSTSFESNDRAYALALPGQTAAPAVAGECLEHIRGGSGLSIGVSGRTRLNEACAARVHCLALADRYAAWGRVELAVAQLSTCGGVTSDPAESAVAIPAPAVPVFVTREELERVYSEALAK